MVSAAEQLASNLNLGAFGKAEELKKRIWFTLAALIVYRLGTYIPMPGINPAELAKIFSNKQNSILGMFNLFAGGAIGRMAIFALNIMPYISASIIIQLLTSVLPTFEQLKKEGEAGRKKINQYTRYGTLFLSAVQAYGIAIGLEGSGGVVLDPGWFFRISTVITLVGGTMFLMWLGEQITQRGVGNGISLIIFAGIVAEFPAALVGILEAARHGTMPTFVLLARGRALADRGHRLRRACATPTADPVSQAPARQQDVAGDSSFLPLKLNTSGVIPPIFASSLLLLPTTIAQFAAQRDRPGLAEQHRRRPRPRAVDLPAVVCRPDRVLRLLLHGRRLQYGRDG